MTAARDSGAGEPARGPAAPRARRGRRKRAAGRPAGDSRTREAIGDAARAQFADFGYHGATIRGIAAAADVDPALVHHYYGTKEALFAAAMRLPVVPSEALTAALTQAGLVQPGPALSEPAQPEPAQPGPALSEPALSEPPQPGRARAGPAQAEQPEPGQPQPGQPRPGSAQPGSAPAGPARTRPGYGAQLVRTALTLWESEEVNATFVGLLRSAVTSEQAAVMLREFIADSILGTVARITGLDELPSRAEAEYRTAMVATQMLGLALTRLVLKLPAVAGATVDELAGTVGPSVERCLAGDIDVPARLAAAGSASRPPGDGVPGA